MDYQQVNVAEVMQYYLDFFRLQTDEKGIDFRIKNQISGESAIIRTDKHKLDGILINLIKNAIKFTSKGTIEIGNYVENDKLCFFVSDSGRGIPEDKVEIIFDRFAQAELGNTRTCEGSGIGLSIVKAYVEALDGNVQVKSKVDKGSTFLFSIPYHPEKLEIKKLNKIEVKELRTIEKVILVAEDDEFNYLYLENILSNGFKLIHAESGEEAVQLFMDNPEIFLIIMDIKMPGKFDGLEAIRKIK